MESTQGHKDPKTYTQRQKAITHNFIHQYARRLIFYDPILYEKAKDKVSFKDFFLHPDFTLDDMYRYMVLSAKQLEIGLPWVKDSMIEACVMASLDIKDKVGAANIGPLGAYLRLSCKWQGPLTLDKDARIKILGGWIYNRRHGGPITNEVWWVRTLRNLKEFA